MSEFGTPVKNLVVQHCTNTKLKLMEQTNKLQSQSWISRENNIAHKWKIKTVRKQNQPTTIYEIHKNQNHKGRRHEKQ